MFCWLIAGLRLLDVIEQGRQLGLDIAVLDHHEAEDRLPPANFIVNPKRQDDSSGFDVLAACGVAYLTCVAVRARLRERGYFAEQGLAEPPLTDLLDIVALGTVCDMVPLVGPNRFVCESGDEADGPAQ